MDYLHEFAEQCLFSDDIGTKIQLTHQAKQLLDAGKLKITNQQDSIRPCSEARFPDRPLLLPPKAMPKRSFHSLHGQQAFFHAMAHIEFVAIYLAWDIAYRFRGLPSSFYLDWLRIADEEATHFELIRQHLLTLDCDYGDLPAHQGLWLHAQETEHDLLARLAIVPRCLEARGLDVTPNMIRKFELMENPAAVALLSRIYHDEIGHVQCGTYWFNHFCQQRELEPILQYQSLLLEYYPGKPKGPFNREARIIAGFSDDELDWLENKA